MKKIFSLFLAIAIVSLASAQKVVKDANAEKRNVSGYHAIEVSGGIDLYLSQGDESVAVSASETKFRERIITEVKNGVLKIWYERDEHKNIQVDWGNRKLKAYVSFKTLDALNGSGGSDITVDGSIKGNKLDLVISGGSDFQGRVEMKDLDINASGGSDLDISGTVTNLGISLSGGSDLDGFDLSSDICKLEASGGSDVNVTVNKELTAQASGSSDIVYKGSGVIKDMKSSGSSSIKKAGK